MAVKYFVQTVAPGVAALESRKHSLNDIRSDALIIRGIEPIDPIVSRPGPLLFVELVEVYLFILQFMLVPSLVKSILIKWGSILKS